MSTAVTIRPLRSDDRAQWAEMWRDYLAFYETEVPDEVYDCTFVRLLGDDPLDFSCFVAKLDGRLAGRPFPRYNLIEVLESSIK